MRVSALLAVSILLVASTGSGVASTTSRTSGARTTGQVLGVVRASPLDVAVLARLDSATLEPVPGRRVALGRNTGAWSYSPDRRELAIGVDRALGVRLVDVHAMRRIADVETKNGDVLALAWLAPRRIVGLDRVGVFVVDPIAHQLVRFVPEEGTLLGAAQTRWKLIVLMGPPSTRSPVAPVTEGAAALAPARLLIVDAAGNVASVQIERVQSGWAIDAGGPPEAWEPALAVDRASDRAFVVGGGAPIAEIDLRTHNVTYHELRGHHSLLDRALGWLLPAAAAKAPLAGPTRKAAWLGNGLLAIAGADVHVHSDARNLDVTTDPLGLQLVDARDWTVRTIEPRATGFAYSSDVLLAFAGSFDAQYRETNGIGLNAFDLNGSRVFHSFGDAPIYWAEIVGSRAYVAPERRVVAVDLSSGRVVHTLAGPLPQIVR